MSCGLVFHKRICSAGRDGIVLGGLILAAGMAGLLPARAQSSSASSAITASQVAPPGAPSLVPGETRDYKSLAVEGWMLTPSFLAGATFDDNIFQSTTSRRRAAGLHLRPAVSGVRDAGIHKTTVNAVGDLRFFPGNASANLVNAFGQLGHVWEAQRDLIFRGAADYARVTDMFNNGFLIGSGGQFGLFGAPQRYNIFGGAASATKSLDKTFVSLGADIHATTFDALYTTSGAVGQAYRNNLIPTLTGRLGYGLTPLLAAYVEATGNFRNFEDSFYNSSGYRIVAGLSSDRISLFRGEIFAGYQRQRYESFLFGSPQSPVLGGRIFWYPTRAITVGVSADQTFQDSGLTVVGNATGSASRVTGGLATLDYAMSRIWTASLRGGFYDVSYLYGGRHDHRWIAGAQFNYSLWRNLDATCEYSFASVDSNVPGGSFARNQITIGATYRY